MLFVVSIAAVVAMTSVILFFQMGQPRIWMSMSRDGLLPHKFASIHPKYKTPGFSTIMTGLVVGIPIFFTDPKFVLDFTSIGTLFAFVLVCGGVLTLKLCLLPSVERFPPRTFYKTPLLFPEFKQRFGVENLAWVRRLEVKTLLRGGRVSELTGLTGPE